MNRDAHFDMLERLKYRLEDWADWMKSDNSRLSYPSRAAGLLCEAYSHHFEDLLDETESTVMQAIDAAVESLTPAQRGAVHRRYGICAVWRFPRPGYTYEQALSDAHEALLVDLPHRSVVI